MDTTESSDSAPFFHLGFVQLSQKAAVSVSMRSTDAQQLSTRLGDEIKRDLLSRSAEVAANRMMNLTAGRHDLLL